MPVIRLDHHICHITFLIFSFSIYWELSSQLTDILQRGWNHQPDTLVYIQIPYFRSSAALQPFFLWTLCSFRIAKRQIPRFLLTNRQESPSSVEAGKMPRSREVTRAGSAFGIFPGFPASSNMPIENPHGKTQWEMNVQWMIYTNGNIGLINPPPPQKVRPLPCRSFSWSPLIRSNSEP